MLEAQVVVLVVERNQLFRWNERKLAHEIFRQVVFLVVGHLVVAIAVKFGIVDILHFSIQRHLGHTIVQLVVVVELGVATLQGLGGMGSSLVIFLHKEVDARFHCLHGRTAHPPTLVGGYACVGRVGGCVQVGKDEVVGLLQGGSWHGLLITGGLLQGQSRRGCVACGIGQAVGVDQAPHRHRPEHVGLREILRFLTVGGVAYLVDVIDNEVGVEYLLVFSVPGLVAIGVAYHVIDVPRHSVDDVLVHIAQGIIMVGGESVVV